MADTLENKPNCEESNQAAEERPHKHRLPRGFSAMDHERQRQIAREGGRSAHQQGKAHEFTSEEAREAGRKGGRASGLKRSNAAKQKETNEIQSSGNQQQKESNPHGQESNTAETNTQVNNNGESQE